jgi:predicted nuclease of restriction endonuclease-like RecB superfamily
MSYRRSFKPRKKKGKVDEATGTRSKYESSIQTNLEKRKVSFGYETEQLEYDDTVRGGFCCECGSRKVAKKHKYTPDFVITRKDGTKLYVEAKGYFKSTDRSKMRAVLKSNPDLDIRMMFMSNGKIDEDTRYSDWCEKYGMQYVIGKEVPNQWLV